jgi:hypothetical protein
MFRKNPVPLVVPALLSFAVLLRKLFMDVWAGLSLLTWGGWVPPVVRGAAVCCRLLSTCCRLLPGRPAHESECSSARSSGQ